MKLIAGLGNPGLFYRRNRHNIGFMCLDFFAKSYHIELNKKEKSAKTGSGEVDGIPVLLVKPMTYMNASGEAVSRLMDKFKIVPQDLIVIHDDMDLPLGRIRIRPGGSPGGHKGIISIIENTGSQEFIRVRVGIGRPANSTANRSEVIDHVLSDFDREEKKMLEEIIPRANAAIHTILIEGVSAAMNTFNTAPEITGTGS